MGASSKRFFHFFLIGISIFCAFRINRCVSILKKGGSFAGRAVRISIRDLDGSAGRIAERPEILGLGLLQGGCRVAQPSLKINQSYSSIDYMVVYHERILADGYFFTIAPSRRDLQILSWKVEVSADVDGSWTAVGASTWRILPDGSADLHFKLPFVRKRAEHQEDSRSDVEVDMRPDTSWLITNAIIFSVNGLGGISCVIVSGRIDNFVRIFKLWFATIGIAWVFAACCCNTVFMWREAIALWLKSLGRVLSCLIVLKDDSYLLSAFMFVGLTDCFSSILSEVWLYEMSWRHFAYNFLMSGIAVVIFLFGVCMLFYRRHVLVHAQNIICADMLRYDAIWAETIDEPALCLLCEMVQRIKQFYPHVCSVPRQFQGDQYCRAVSKCTLSTIFRSSFNLGSLYLLRRGPNLIPVDSLDQLFVQATCLHPILLSKVKEWACKSSGYFPSCKDPCYIQYCSHPDNHNDIKWAKVKTVSRAIEKLVRVYNQVISLLSFSIYFLLDLLHIQVFFDPSHHSN